MLRLSNTQSISALSLRRYALPLD